MIVDKAQMEIELVSLLVKLLQDTPYFIIDMDHFEEVIYIDSIDTFSSFQNSVYLPFSVKGYKVKLEEQ